jgi:hypothetical protein
MVQVIEVHVDRFPAQRAPRARPFLLWIGPHDQWVVASFRKTSLWGECWEFDGGATLKLGDGDEQLLWAELPKASLVDGEPVI